MGFSVDFSELEQLVNDMKITEQDFNQFDCVGRHSRIRG
jgi:hypothetical protein